MTATIFGALLQAHLDRRGWSQTRLGAASASDHSYVSRCIAGTRIPSRWQVLRWAKALELSDQDTDLLLMSCDLMPASPEVRAAITLMVKGMANDHV